MEKFYRDGVCKIMLEIFFLPQPSLLNDGWINEDLKEESNAANKRKNGTNCNIFPRILINIYVLWKQKKNDAILRKLAQYFEKRNVNKATWVISTELKSFHSYLNFQYRLALPVRFLILFQNCSIHNHSEPDNQKQ